MKSRRRWAPAEPLLWLVLLAASQLVARAGMLQNQVAAIPVGWVDDLEQHATLCEMAVSEVYFVMACNDGWIIIHNT